MFEPYQITINCGITSIQKRWLFIQQECNKYCAAFESVEARPVSGLGVGDMVCSPLPSPFLATAMRLRPCICLHVHLLLIMWCRHFNLWKHSRPGTMTSHSLLRIVGRSSTIALSSRINTVNFKEERQEDGQVRRRWRWRGVEEAEGQDQLQGGRHT